MPEALTEPRHGKRTRFSLIGGLQNSCRISRPGDDFLATMTDSELLRQYSQGRSQDAFSELARRYVNLVYSAAWRQVGSSHLAEDVAQSVFVTFARESAHLGAVVHLGGWLYTMTRRTAIDMVRSEIRRREREGSAAEIAAANSTPASWPRIEPLLDEAMAALRPSDRDGVLLRYFENKSLKEVGEALGVSEDAAQKRISRSIDDLRAFFQKRGVTTGAAALAGELSAHAVESAPISLSSAISAAVPTAAGWTASGASKIIATTSVQKVAVVAVVLLTGASLIEAGVIIGQESGLRSLRLHSGEVSDRLLQLANEWGTGNRRLASLDRQIDAALTDSSQSDDALETQIETLLARVTRLRQLQAERPGKDDPQLRLLTEKDWFDVASRASVDSEDGIRGALSQLRSHAQNKMQFRLQAAMSAYLSANAGTLPDDPAQLAPYCDPPTDADILDQYKMLKTGQLDISPTGRDPSAYVIAMKAPVDVEYDGYGVYGPFGGRMNSAISFDVEQAQTSFASANDGQKATSADQLLAYLPWPADPSSVAKELGRKSNGGAK